jgi:hypothetical protein
MQVAMLNGLCNASRGFFVLCNNSGFYQARVINNPAVPPTLELSNIAMAQKYSFHSFQNLQKG